MYLELNRDKIKEMEDDLIKFEGFIPPLILFYINSLKRWNYLKKIGLYDEIREVHYYYRILLKENDTNGEMMNKLILDFIDKNPQFKDIVVN